jgi:hypothetical protein
VDVAGYDEMRAAKDGCAREALRLNRCEHPVRNEAALAAFGERDAYRCDKDLQDVGVRGELEVGCCDDFVAQRAKEDQVARFESLGRLT